MQLTIIGAGAIGGTIGAHMIRAGHDITFCDVDEDHVNAMNEHGITIEGPVENFTVKTKAILPSQLPATLHNVAVAVKSHHTKSAAELLRGRLAPDGFVVTLQNGLTAQDLSDVVGADRVIVSFVNFGADYIAPGRIMQGNIGTFRVGELTGNKITPRVLGLVDAFPYAEATANILGFLWGKEAYGAMLYAGATSDLSIADHLENPKYRPLMLAIAREVLAQAPVTPEAFDGFDPKDLDGSLDRLVTFNRKSAKTHSGIYRDLTVRKRKTEVDDLLRDLKGPLTNFVGAIIHSIERGERICEIANLDLLAAYERAFRLGAPLNAISHLISAPERSLNGPLLGVAVGVKDIIDIKGQPRGNGNPHDMKSLPATKDAPVIAQLRALAADVFTTTSLLEYAAGATHPEVPEAMNPYNSHRTAGGSSGGSAALVGVGVCDVALGTDTGGSIRIPAHYCGTVGFKPSYGSISLEGVTPLSPTFDHVGLLAKDLATTTKVFSALMGGLKAEERSQIKGLKVGIVKTHFELAQLEKDVAESIRDVIAKLQNEGAEIIEVDDRAFQELEKTFGDILHFEAWQVHGEKVKSDPTHFGPETLRLFKSAQSITEDAYKKASARRIELLPNALKIYEGIDVLLTPVAPYVAPPTTPPMDTPEGVVEGAYTSIFNLTGDPAISIPCGLNSEGLPIGVQLATAKGTDMQLLSIAQAIEELLNFHLVSKREH
ncbi:MAG TPA: amidase family protein [Candidatus Paceibacterota bacterium]|nr:amidase family protein [Candidatus Paceibacterota bacterium]